MKKCTNLSSNTLFSFYIGLNTLLNSTLFEFFGANEQTNSKVGKIILLLGLIKRQLPFTYNHSKPQTTSTYAVTIGQDFVNPTLRVPVGRLTRKKQFWSPGVLGIMPASKILSIGQVQKTTYSSTSRHPEKC